MPLSRILHSEELCVHVLSFLGGVADVHALERCSLELALIFHNDLIWRFAYDSFYPCVNSYSLMTEQMRRQVHRPFGEACVGWAVRVLQESDVEASNTHWRTGVITQFRTLSSAEEFLVDYSDEQVWEQQHRNRVRHHLVGLSRFDFLTPPSSNEAQTLSTSNAGAIPRQRNPHNFVSWRRECASLHRQLPTHLGATLEVHSDEVLDVEFSHDGRFLVSCSRDGSICVTEFVHEGNALRIGQTFRRQTFHLLHACKICWSALDSYFSIVMECDSQMGSPSGLVEVVELRNGHLVGSSHLFDIFPYDFYALWLDDVTMVYSAEVHMGARDRFVQTLVLHSCVRDACRFSLIGSSSNFARAPEVLRMQRGGEGPVREVLVFMSGDNPFITYKLFFLDVADALAAQEPIDTRALPHIDLRGAVLNIHASRTAATHRYLMVNCRPFLNDDYLAFEGLSHADSFAREIPDVSSAIDLLVFDLHTLTPCYSFRGHHAFTLKNCLFFLYIDCLAFESDDGVVGLDTCDLIASGSEENNIYVWHRGQQRLVKVLRGHSNTASTVSFNPRFPGVLASGADDFSVKVWISDAVHVKEAPDLPTRTTKDVKLARGMIKLTS